MNKRKIGITGASLTGLGGIITAITVPIVERIHKDEDVLKIMTRELNAMNNNINRVALDTRDKIYSIDNKQTDNNRILEAFVRDLEYKVREFGIALKNIEKQYTQ